MATGHIGGDDPKSEIFYDKDQAIAFAEGKDNAEIIYRPGFPIQIDGENVYLSKDDMPAWVVWYDL